MAKEGLNGCSVILIFKKRQNYSEISLMPVRMENKMTGDDQQSGVVKTELPEHIYCGCQLLYP